MRHSTSLHSTIDQGLVEWCGSISTTASGACSNRTRKRSSLVRSEGIKTLFNAQQKMQQGEMPGREVMGGMMLALAGLLLIIPGFVTDFFGILLLQPWLRNMLADKLIGSNQFRMQMGGFQARQQPFEPGPGDDRPGQSTRGGGNTIEGEFERKE